MRNPSRGSRGIRRVDHDAAERFAAAMGYPSPWRLTLSRWGRWALVGGTLALTMSGVML
ncbi:MAG: hypothetical protein U0Y82_02845 [Thermoleophilia bacterium]